EIVSPKRSNTSPSPKASSNFLSFSLYSNGNNTNYPLSLNLFLNNRVLIDPSQNNFSIQGLNILLKIDF
ncbi:MAG: hypothetical protein EBU93_01705, partial [Chlamydiae bacterium]|nr:hypothetical protein [Chlamydiota bacterium]